MTTEYATVPHDLTAGQAIRHLRQTAAEAETIFYVYVTDVGDHLVGVFSLSDLILAQPDAKLTDFMHHRVVKVNLEDSQDAVAHIVAKYNLLAVPVVDTADRGHRGYHSVVVCLALVSLMVTDPPICSTNTPAPDCSGAGAVHNLFSSKFAQNLHHRCCESPKTGRRHGVSCPPLVD